MRGGSFYLFPNKRREIGTKKKRKKRFVERKEVGAKKRNGYRKEEVGARIINGDKGKR